MAADPFQELAQLAATRWCCKKCDCIGVVTYDSGAGVYEVIDLLRADHRKASLTCDLDLASMKVEVVEWA